MTPYRAALAWLAATAAVAAGGLVYSVQTPRGPKPSLRGTGALIASGKLDEARARVDACLRADPDDPDARLLAAEIAVSQTDPQPQRALRLLRDFPDGDLKLLARAKVAEGKAAYLLDRYDRAEACWAEALRLDPEAPEAAWALLDLFYLEGRGDDARRLALRQHAVEPDPRDRVRLLVELVRQDAQPPDPASVVERFAPALRRHPGEFRAALAVGLALVHSSRPDEGLALLRGAVERHPSAPEAWDALLTGLDDAGRAPEMAAVLKRVPPALAGDPRLARHRGRAAQERRDWSAAAHAYRRAVKGRPHDLVSAYRLAQALRAVGDTEGAREADRRARAAQAARDRLLDLYHEAEAVPSLAPSELAPLCRRLADNRDRLGRRDEARAWLRLALRAAPRDPETRLALDRMK